LRVSLRIVLFSQTLLRLTRVILVVPKNTNVVSTFPLSLIKNTFDKEGLPSRQKSTKLLESKINSQLFFVVLTFNP